jgi:hypothetical protein
MAQEFNIKVGDRLPYLAATLLDGDGAPVDLSTALSVALRMRLQTSDTPVFTTNCVVTSAANGRVEYRWAAGNTATAGDYYGEFVVSWPGPLVQTIPNAGAFRIKISGTLE